MEWLFRHPWSRPMPRIEDRLLKSVIYLYKSKEDAESGAPGGTGFWLGSRARSQEPCSCSPLRTPTSRGHAQLYALLAL
jgi:hypothetical protein